MTNCLYRMALLQHGARPATLRITVLNSVRCVWNRPQKRAERRQARKIAAFYSHTWALGARVAAQRHGRACVMRAAGEWWVL